MLRVSSIIRHCVSSTLAVLALLPTTLQAADLSLLSGFYKSEKSKTDGDKAGGKNTIQFGMRFGDELDQKFAWFGQGMIKMRSYDAGEAGKAPSNSTSLGLGGGLRYYFDRFAGNTTPYVYGVGMYKNEKDGQVTPAGYSEKEDNGLYYGAAVGIRIGLETDFFVDIETTLFESALFATEKKTTVIVAANNTTGEVKQETSKTELYVDTDGAFQEIIVSLGMKI